MRRYFGRVFDEEEESEINITPMLDVVFILLIFFIVTTSFVREAGIEVDTPRARTTAFQDATAIVVGVSQHGEYWVEGKPVDARRLRAHLARLHAGNPQGGVVIQADANSRTQDVITAMDAARQAGIRQVAIASQEP